MKSKTKTRKNLKLTIPRKKQFIQSILRQWKKQTVIGHYYRDTTSRYKDDYYLCLHLNDYYNHIHIVLNNFKTNYNLHNNILFVMKKGDCEDDNIVHSNEIKTSIFSDPEKVVHNLIRRFDEFNHSA